VGQFRVCALIGTRCSDTKRHPETLRPFSLAQLSTINFATLSIFFYPVYMLLKLLLGTLCFIFLQFPHPPPPPLIPPFKVSTQSAAPLGDDLHDDSDWFSGLRPTGSDSELSGDADTSSVQEREIPPTNFRILGIDLSPDMFKPIEQRFGKLHEVQRGDASSGRSQVCYVSANGEPKVHLIFEQGEVDSSVYIFVGGPDWYGNDRCLPSKLVSEKLASASGLRLSLTPAQVIAILGKPSRCQIPAPFTTSNDSTPKNSPYPCGHRPATNSPETELLYSLHKTRTMTAQERADFLRNNPTLTPQDVDERWATYDWGAGIDARFTHGRLTFLAISLSETN